MTHMMRVVCRLFAICHVFCVGAVQMSIDPAGVVILAPRLLCFIIAPSDKARTIPCEPAHSSASSAWLSTPQGGLPLRPLRSKGEHTTSSVALLAWQGCAVADGETGQRGRACIVMRGGCSFDAKVANAKQLQCSALLIVDNAERALQPPGLRDAAAATIPS